MRYFEVRLDVEGVYTGSVFYEIDDEDAAYDLDGFTVADAPGYDIGECGFEDWREAREAYGWYAYCAYPSYGHSFMVLVGDGGLLGDDDVRADYVFGSAVESWEPAD